jgi:hypothetical protein
VVVVVVVVEEEAGEFIGNPYFSLSLSLERRYKAQRQAFQQPGA